jgi:hypothetical protein
MGKIISKRGQVDPEPVEEFPPEEEYVITSSTIYVYDGMGNQLPLTQEELDHIREVFEGIRKALNVFKAF